MEEIGGVKLNVYVCKAFKGSKLVHIKYIEALSPQYALSEFKSEMDLEEVNRYYYDVRQVD